MVEWYFVCNTLCCKLTGWSKAAAVLVRVRVAVESGSPPLEGDGRLGLLGGGAGAHSGQQALEVFVAQLAHDLAAPGHHAQVVLDHGSVLRLRHFNRVY